MDTTEVDRPAAAVVALKPGEYAKSRLGVAAPLRQRLAWTMALDTLRALTAALPRVLVVSGAPALASRLARAGIAAEVLPESGTPGLNAALALGADRLRAEGVASVLACVGDLPALRPGSVRRVLGVAGAYGRAFLADASGTGTTMLVARRTALEPSFQGRSAARHRASGAVPLTDDLLGEPLADARRDVDTEVDLTTAAGLGVGPFTGALLDPATGRLGRYAVVTTTAWADAESGRQAVTGAGRRIALPDEALAEGLRSVRPGQRLHAVTGAESVLSAWL